MLRLSESQGLDAVTGEDVDLFKAGVVDPARVTRSAVQHAVSIASLLLTTETLIVDKPVEKGGRRRRCPWPPAWHGHVAGPSRTTEGPRPDDAGRGRSAFPASRCRPW